MTARRDPLGSTRANRTAATHPGYVRLIVPCDEGLARIRAACRKFASLCEEEGSHRGLIVAESQHPFCSGSDFDEGFELAAAALGPGFKLAVVARGPAQREIASAARFIAARRRARVKLFSSEHVAAAWLMG